MYRYLKLLHIIGFAMFLGSILAHIVTSRIEPGGSDASVLLYARETICIATRASTVPGLLLLILSGTGMVWLTRGESLRRSWLRVHIAFAAAIAINTIYVVIAVARLTWAAQAWSQGSGSLEAFASPAAVETFAGAANVAMILLAAGIAILRPGFRRVSVAPERVAE